MSSAISVSRLGKTFSCCEKELGVKNPIRNLFHQKELFEEAVKGISFDIGEGERPRQTRNAGKI